MTIKASIFAVAVLAAATAEASSGGRGYEDAVSCKALSELASNVGDDDSKIAIANIDAKIAENGSPGQASADVQYARLNWRASSDLATLQSEWRNCVAAWKD